MSKFLDTLFAIIASSIVLLIRTSQDPSKEYTFFGLWIYPILLALVAYILLQFITHLIKSSQRPLKQYEGYWIETIYAPAMEGHNKYISIMELTYTNNSYSIRGSTFLPTGADIATWRADRTHLYDKRNKLLDYIYTADINNQKFPETTIRGYATIDFKTQEGYIIDIMNEDTKKQHFVLTDKITNLSDIEKLPGTKKLKSNLIRFFNSK